MRVQFKYYSKLWVCYHQVFSRSVNKIYLWRICVLKSNLQIIFVIRILFKISCFLTMDKGKKSDRIWGAWVA